MNNPYMDFWQTTLTDIFDPSSHMQKMDKLVEQSMASFEEFNSLVQKLGYWDFLFKPMDPSMFNVFKSMEPYLKHFGLISIEEYQALINKYEELKKESRSSGKIEDDQKKKIADLSKTISNEKKKLANRDKTIEANKAKLNDLKKELTQAQKKSDILEKEKNDLIKQIETLKNKAKAKSSATA